MDRMSTEAHDPYTTEMLTEIRQLAVRIHAEDISFREAGGIIDALIGGEAGCSERKRAMGALKKRLVEMGQAPGMAQ
jgi:hypothetical protein